MRNLIGFGMFVLIIVVAFLALFYGGNFSDSSRYTSIYNPSYTSGFYQEASQNGVSPVRNIASNGVDICLQNQLTYPGTLESNSCSFRNYWYNDVNTQKTYYYTPNYYAK